MILKVIGVGICSSIINVVLKQYKPEFCVISNICAGFIMLGIVVNGGKDLLINWVNIENLSGLNLEVLSPVLKVIGIGYITEFAADVAEESGNKSIATKMILGGKIAICVTAFPVVIKLLNAILSLI